MQRAWSKAMQRGFDLSIDTHGYAQFTRITNVSINNQPDGRGARARGHGVRPHEFRSDSRMPPLHLVSSAHKYAAGHLEFFAHGIAPVGQFGTHDGALRREQRAGALHGGERIIRRVVHATLPVAKRSLPAQRASSRSKVARYRAILRVGSSSSLPNDRLRST